MNLMLQTASVSLMASILLISTTNASDDTIGTNGIRSMGLALPNGSPLKGTGIGLGQYEGFRPGDPVDPSGAVFDTMDVNGSLINSFVNPEEVFFADFGLGAPTVPNSFSPNQNGFVPPPTPTFPNPVNFEINEHAVQVASVMISRETQPPGMPSSEGVSTGAKLFSIGNSATTQGSDAVAIQHLTQANSGDIRAINISYQQTIEGETNTTEGNSTLTQFIDWSAKQHNILYVVAGEQLDNVGAPSVTPVPTKNYNGMTIGMSERNATSGVFDRVSNGNDYSNIANERTHIDLIAPGVDVLLGSFGDTNKIDEGTSFAAPHVTGTVALTQEYGDFQIAAGVPNWGGMVTTGPAPGPTARRHEVMKAVLMNSADKIEDTSGTGKYLGMDRTVLKRNGDNWFDSEAFMELNEFGELEYDNDTPLDEEMGAGHLNAKRALQQFIPGEQEVNGNFNTPIVGDVPLIGWDYGTISGPNFPINKYVLDTPLEAGNFISITLAWDREVEFANDVDMDGEYDIVDTFQTYTDLDDVLTNLDLYLVPAGTFDVGEDDIAISESKVTSVEHIFTEIPEDGDYEIWVFRDEQFAPPQDYGIAWWYGLAPELEPPLLSGDFDGDNDVDGADFLAWQRNPGVGDLSAWESEYGMTSALATANVVPEPTGLLLLVLGLLLFLSQWRSMMRPKHST